MDIDISDLVKRTQRSSYEVATRYLNSAQMQIGGFEVPVDLDADDTAFAKALASLPSIAEVASRAGATT
ncbi:MAG: sugar phosphate isomerase/epimerase, partial [Pirellulaceae bacterium]